MKADAEGTPAERAGTSMSLKAREDVLEQGFFDEKAEWNYARNVEVCCWSLLPCCSCRFQFDRHMVVRICTWS
jgi:hypothetical protein